MRNSRAKWGLVLGGLILMAGARGVLHRVDSRGKEARLFSGGSPDAQDPEAILVASLLGGFRGVFATALWLRAQTLKSEGKYYEMIDNYRMITRLQPGHAAAWAFQAWDLAYNVSVDFTNDPADRVFWVFRGINLLRHEAIPRNPRSPELHQELAWIFHHKLGFDTDDARAHYRRRLANEVSRALGPIPPSAWRVYGEIADLRERFPTRRSFLGEPSVVAQLKRLHEIAPQVDLLREALALSQRPPKGLAELLREAPMKEAIRRAGLWQIGAAIKKDLGMSPRRMMNLCERLGPIDFRLPEAQALYWGSIAEQLQNETRPDKMVMRYQFVINHSLMKLVLTGDAMETSDGQLFFLPNYDFSESVVKVMEERFAEHRKRNEDRHRRGLSERSDDALREGYKNFLINMALNTYLDERPMLCAKMLERLRELTGDNQAYGLDAKGFVARELARRLETMSDGQALALVRVFFVRGCVRLARGDRGGYRRRVGWARLLHKFLVDRERKLRPEGTAEGKLSAGSIPRLFDLKRRSLLLMLEGKLPQLGGRDRIQALLSRLRGVDPALHEALRSAWRRRTEPPASVKGGAR